MRRVMRILSLLGALLSFIACVGIIALWVWSYWKPQGKSRQDYLSDREQFRMYGWCSARGTFAFDLYVNQFAPGQVVWVDEHEWFRTQLHITGMGILGVKNNWVETNSVEAPPAEHWWENLGVYVRPRMSAYMLPGKAWRAVFRLPYWFLLLLATLGMAPWIFGRWRRGRQPQGHCKNCGYDLRASPERCPECGAENSALGTSQRVGASKVAS